jgi:spermidine synthase
MPPRTVRRHPDEPEAQAYSKHSSDAGQPIDIERFLMIPDHSDVTLSEEDGVRYLHFGTPWIQGAMRLSRPSDIELDYVRRMMAWLLFMSPPDEILQLGLGAGALTRFCHRRLSHSQITVVERDRQVIDVARLWFALPREDARLQVLHTDAAHVVREPASLGRFGVIQADLYDAQARGPVLDSLAFYRDCRRALAAPGMLVVNLFGASHGFSKSLDRIHQAFDGRVLAMAPVPAGNRVVLAFNGPPLSVTGRMLMNRAAVLSKRYGLSDARIDWLGALAVRGQDTVMV